MANTIIDITNNGITTLATAGKYCDRNIDINVNVTASQPINHKFVCSNNIMDDVIPVPNTYIQGGREIAYTNWTSSDFIQITPGALYYFEKATTLQYGSLYDSNKQYIGIDTISFSGVIICPDNAHYMRISESTSRYSTIVLKEISISYT